MRFEIHLRPHSSFEANMRKTVGLFIDFNWEEPKGRNNRAMQNSVPVDAEPAWPGMRPNSSGLV